MFLYSENNLQSNKYSQYFFKVVYNSYSKNNFDFKNYTLEQTKQLLTLLIKEICHHYMINKIKISKAIVNVALETYEKTIFKNHPDITNLASIVYNNIGCIYARNNSYEKSLKFLNRYFKYSNNNIDNLIYYNNIIRVYSKMNGKISDIKDLMQKFKLLIDTEISNLKNENFSNNKNIDIEKVKLLSFLYYNYGFCLENILEKTKESKEQYTKGYEFTICFLGENSLEAERYMIKLYQDREVSKVNNISKKSKKKRD
jgi:tetratricopeptide (TPR) repeat protein